MKVILDSAVFINAVSFPLSHKNDCVISSGCVSEIKASLSRSRLDAALVERRVRILDPSPAFVAHAKELAETHGVLRLSPADLSVVGLGVEFLSQKEKVCVFTDDYSIQNVLKWARVPFKGILQNGIKQKRSFRKKT